MNFRADQSRRFLDEGKTETVVVGIQQIAEITLLFGGEVVNEVAMGQRGISPIVREGVRAAASTPSLTVGLLPHDCHFTH